MTSLAVPSDPLTPDQYKNYALQDPGFLGLQSALKGNEDAFRAQARGGINSGIISLGIAPPDSSLKDWIDPSTAAAAAANPLSTDAGLRQQHTNNLRTIQNSLAARGAYDSGELTYGLGNENTRDASTRADALSKFMQYANGLFGNLGSMQASDAAQLGGELGNAAMRQLALHPGSTTTANWDDNTGTYVDASGNHYDQYGNHIGSGPSAPATNFGGPTNPNNVGYTPTGDAAQWQPLSSNNGATDNAFFVGQTPPPDQPIITRTVGGTSARPY